MRHAGAVASGILMSAALFSSCTCHNELTQPSFQEPPGGFHAAAPSAKPQARAQAPTPTGARPPGQVAEAGPTAPPGMPGDFPKDLPVFKDASLSQVQDLANNAHNVIFTTAAPVADVWTFYQDKMTSGGWKATQQFQRSNHAFLSFEKGKMVANITIAADERHPGQQLIAIMYEEQRELDFDEF